MRTRGRDWWRLVVGGLLVVGAVAWAWWVVSRPPGEARSDASSYGQFVLALAGVLVAGWGPLARALRPAEPRDLDVVADLLARVVHAQWRQAAVDRRLRSPIRPIPLRWSLCDDPVGPPPEAALPPPGTSPPFPPLPGMQPVGRGMLRGGGGQPELHRVYGGLGSGRLLVVGRPGAGKSGAAVLLLLDALAHRERVKAAERARVPVPVLLTLHGWDPATPFAAWLAARLAADYPVFARRGGREEARELVDAGRVAAILDGLDEVPEPIRPDVLRALAFAPCRIVLLTRTAEMVGAAHQAWLTGAVALRVEDVDHREAAAYLARALAGPPPKGWDALVAELRGAGAGPLAEALVSPLALTLPRDTYRPGDDVGELLDVARQHGREAAEDHLLGRVVAAAYRQEPGQPPPPYGLDLARRTLTVVARELDGGRDATGRRRRARTYVLAWWTIPGWVPARPRAVAAGLAAGLAFGLSSAAGWQTQVAAVQLAWREGTPIRLMRFLDDAHRRGVLRAVGPIYQFRHARLQDLLAADGAADRARPPGK